MNRLGSRVRGYGKCRQLARCLGTDKTSHAASALIDHSQSPALCIADSGRFLAIRRHHSLCRG